MKVAYVTNCFGTQSHTFIRREVQALRRRGLLVDLYGIRPDPTAPADTQEFIRETHYLYPLSAGKALSANLGFLLRNPARYLGGAIGAFWSREFGFRRRCKMLYHYFLSAVFAREMLRNGISHIHAHFMNVSASIAMYASHHSRIPFSITVHSAGTYGTPHILGVNQKLRKAGFLLMISEYNVEYFDAIEPCRNKSHVVRCGMDLTRFVFRGIQPMHSPVRILAVGRFVQKKGFLYLVEAAAKLKEQGMAYLLTIIGDGPDMTLLKERARSLGVGNEIVFTGQQHSDYVYQAMRESDIVVVPSVTSDSGEKEGLPVVIMEAMATGVPVIASDHSGIKEIVKHGVTGLLTEEKDVEGIAQAISSMCNRDTRQLVEAAYQLVDNTFNIEVVADRRMALLTDYGTGGL